MEILRVEHLSKTFTMHLRDDARVAGFHDVSFSVAAGRFLGISGPSGIGKSSLLKCIYRTYTPTSGAIWYVPEADSRNPGPAPTASVAPDPASSTGQAPPSLDSTAAASGGPSQTTVHGEAPAAVDLARLNEHAIIALRRREIGYISQFFHVIPRVTTLRTVTKVLRSLGHEEGDAEERARELLARLRIPESLWNLFPSTFSGGEKQRVNIICAAVRRPRLLLLDEPTASLDRESADEVMRLIEELRADGTAMIGVFHNPDHLARLSDEVFTMPEHTSAPAEARQA